MREYLEALEPTILLLVAGVLRRWAPKSHEFDLHEYDRRKLRNALRARRATADRIVQYVRTLPLDYRARYNLACYYAGVADTASSKRATDANRDRRARLDDRALSELAAALKSSPPDLVEWAKGDPSLRGLRRRRRKKFDALIEEVSPKPKPEPRSPAEPRPASEPS